MCCIIPHYISVINTSCDTRCCPFKPHSERLTLLVLSPLVTYKVRSLCYSQEVAVLSFIACKFILYIQHTMVLLQPPLSGSSIFILLFIKHTHYSKYPSNYILINPSLPASAVSNFSPHRPSCEVNTKLKRW